MRLVSLGGMAAIACAAILAACSDQQPAPTASERTALADGTHLRIQGSASVTVHGKQGTIVYELPSWTASGTMRDGIARDETATSPLGVLGLARPMRGGVDASGGYRTSTFVDDAGKHHTLVWVFAADGGPVRSVRYYVEGTLQHATEYGWSRAGNGFTLVSANRRFYRSGKLTSEFIGTAAGPADVASRGVTSNALAATARSLVRAFGPNEAHAQILSGKCRMEWLAYIASQAAMSAATIALELSPGNPALYFAWLAATAAATIAEMKLYICEQNQDGPIGRPGTMPPIIDPITCKVDPSMPGCPNDPGSIQ